MTCSVGDAVLIYGGTTTADYGTYIIAAVTSATVLTLDRALAGSDADMDFNVIADGVVVENSTRTDVATLRVPNSLVHTSGFAKNYTYMVSDTVTHSALYGWRDLYVDGVTETLRLTIPASSAWTFTVRLVGITANAAKQWNYTLVGSIERDNAGNTTLSNESTVTLFETDSDFDAQAVADDTNEALLIQVQDATDGDDFVKWSATVEVTEVTFP